ncbi:Oxygen sensor histidine kinase NreB [Aquisphaera giovannonii]|uniref:Oxygen sensor histidine kinase NreB n=1 Tax=Aquisphaera giovannonii TaxID=406548 RepID=A0A5B9WFP5_9BACT|nr:PAS domain-containing protein [Aquisphaera giovannonii]QEH38720.1 Oxygen sensor histidine kinase NreB [Aquisphaera giovannonii]
MPEPAGREPDHVAELRAARRAALNVMEDAVAARDALRDGEERLRLAIAVGGLATWDWDVRTGRVVWNDLHFTMQGYMPGKVVPSYEAWLARVHPDDRHAAQAALIAARDAGAPYRHEFRSLHPDGAVRWISARGSFLFDEGGAPVRMIGVAQDVTPQREAEEARRASERQLRLALAAARMGIWIWDVEAGIHTRDASLNRLLGLEPVETRHPFADFLGRVVHPEDRGRVEAAFHESIAHGQPLNIEFRIVRPDGAVRWLRDRGDVLGEGGPSSRFMTGACVDVTDLKGAEAAIRASEERLRLILASAIDFAVFTLAPDRLVTSWSPGAGAIFGYSEAEILGRSADILFTPEDREDAAPEGEARTALRDGRAADERWHIRKDDTRFFASGVLTPMGEGGSLGFVKVLRDLTERKQMEDALREARDRLEEKIAGRTAELEAANAALRETMAARAELLRRNATTQEDERRRISRELHDRLGQELTALIFSLKALGQAVPEGAPGRIRLVEAEAIVNRIGREAHDLAVELRPTALDDIGLGPALADYVSRWSARTGVAADFQSHGLDSRRLPTDIETAVYRVVQEALNNVAKHAHARRASVILERNQGELTAIVEDDGRGFDPSRIARAGPEARPSALGLLGMRERAALLGGSFLVESAYREGEATGTVVRIRIPLSPPEEEGHE